MSGAYYIPESVLYYIFIWIVQIENRKIRKPNNLRYMNKIKNLFSFLKNTNKEIHFL